MRYVLDTNIVLAYIRDHPVSRFIDETYAILNPDNDVFVSAVTVGELRSIALQNNWGAKRIILLNDYLEKFLTTDINVRTVIERYALIDSFSQGRLATIPLIGSARNMGKNDIWIAATASVLGATLLTTDKDFDHLHQIYLEVVRLDLTDHSK